MPRFNSFEEREAAKVKAKEMKAAGKFYAEIGKALNVTESTAFKLCTEEPGRKGVPEWHAPEPETEPVKEPWWVLRPRTRPDKPPVRSEVRPCPKCGREMGYEADGGGLTYLGCPECDLRTGIHADPAECDRDLALGEVVRGYGGAGGHDHEFVHLTQYLPHNVG